MAKAKDNTVELEEIEEEVEETTSVIRPNDLAEELGVDAKRIRAFLRTEFSRDSEAKNTNWELSPEMANKVRARFTASDDEDVENDSDES